MKIAVVNKSPRKTDYDFDFNYDLLHLTDSQTGKKKRLLKADVTLTEEELKDYDLVVLIGAEPSKHIGKITQVTRYNGQLVKDKYVPMVDPMMAKFKPEAEEAIDLAKRQINKYIKGEIDNYSGDYKLITCAEHAKRYLEKVLRDTTIKVVALDTETTALYPKNGYVLGISMSHKEGQGVYIDSDCIDTEVEDMLQAVFNNKLVVLHNAKFDLKMLEYHFGFIFPNWKCTMIMHYILNENEPHDLKFIAMKYCKMGDYEAELETWKREYCRKNKVKLGDFTYDLIPFEILGPYACKDTDATLRAYNLFNSIISKSVGFSRLTDNFLFPANRFLADIEMLGVPFSRNRLLEVQKELDVDLLELRNNIYKYPEIKEVEDREKIIFNPNSVNHLRALLFDKLGLPVIKKTAKGAASTDAEVLETLAKKHHIAEYILKIRKLQKIKSTYIDKILISLDRDSFLRTNFNLTTTTSGRLSSSGKLNMQQLPRDDKRVKSCISMEDIDDSYCIWSQDLQTAEMYYAAVLSGDENLMEVFRLGGDFHSTIAHTVFNLSCSVDEVSVKYPHMRQAAKAVSFGILYGAGPGKVAETTGVSYKEAIQIINQYFSAFPELKKWLTETQEEIASNGYIYSVFNRKRRVPNVFSHSEEERGHAIRSALNFTVQSVASDINLLAAMDMQKWLTKTGKGNIFALVHDSFLGICKWEDIEEVKNMAKLVTENDRGGIIIPDCPIGVDFEYGKNYAFK